MADQLVAERLAPGTRPVRTAGVDAATCVPFARQIAAGVAEWLPGYAEQIDNGSYPAEVSALETDVRAMAHLIHASEAGVNAELRIRSGPPPAGSGSSSTSPRAA